MKKLTVGLLALLLCVSALAAGEKITGSLTVIESTTTREHAIHTLALQTALENPGLAINIDRAPLPDALKALEEGRADLVIAYADQLPAGHKHSRAYAREAALIAVHASNSRKSFTAAELADIFSGKLNDWKQLNGSDYSLHRYAVTEEVPGEGLFRDQIMRERPFAKLYRKSDPAELLILLGANPNAIALLPAIARTTPPDVALAAVDGVAPSTENLGNGKYPLHRDHVIVFGANPSAPARFFIQRLQSADFSDNLKDRNLIPLLP